MEENKVEQERIEIEISLKDLLSVLVKNIWIIVVCAVLCGTAVFLYNRNYVVPIYQAEVIFYIVPVNTLGDDYSDQARLQLESQSLSYAKQVKNTYLQIFQTHAFDTKLENDYSANYQKEINGKIDVSGIIDTELFKVEVTSSSIEDAYDIAKQIETTAPEIILEIIGSDTVRIVDKATKPELPINNNTNRNALIGFLLGAIVVYGIVFLIFMFDRRVKGEEDLKSHYDIPILGGIVDFNKSYRDREQYR